MIICNLRQDEITAGVNSLLDGKKRFKAQTGQDYDAKKKPAGQALPAAAPSGATGALAAWEAATAQGNTVRELKSKKAGKDEVLAAVNVLKQLKEDFQKITGSAYDANKKPASGAPATNAPPAAAAQVGNEVLALWEQTNAVGTKIRDMKAKKASKEEITGAVAELKDR